MQNSMVFGKVRNYISFGVETDAFARNVGVCKIPFFDHDNEFFKDMHEEFGGFRVENDGARHGRPFRQNG